FTLGDWKARPTLGTCHLAASQHLGKCIASLAVASANQAFVRAMPDCLPRFCGGTTRGKVKSAELAWDMMQKTDKSRMENTLGVETVRCAIYARYSSDLQRPASIEDQNRNCFKGGEEKGWTILSEFVRSDAAKSGTTVAGREALDSLVTEACRTPRPFDCVLIDDTSRLGRNLSDVLRLAESFEYDGVFLYFVSQRLDSRDPNFRQLLIMNGTMDEQCVAGLRAKVRRGLEGLVRKG